MGYRGVVNNLQGGGVNALAANHIVVTATMTSATWNTAASHEVFTVTGTVRMWLWNLCTGTLTDAADAADIQFGVAGATDAFIAATAAAGRRCGSRRTMSGCVRSAGRCTGWKWEARYEA